MRKVSTHEKQAQTRFRPSPYQRPCPAGTPPSIPPVPPPAGEQGYTELIQRILEQHEEFKKILVELTAINRSLAVTTKPEEIYYNTPQTVISVATSAQPSSPDAMSNTTTGATGYQAETIYATLGFSANRIDTAKYTGM